MSTTISAPLIHHIAKLANIPIEKKEELGLADAFSQTLKVVENLKELDTTKVEETHQVTGLENIWREDVVEEKRMLSVDQALANASQTQDNHFVVPHVLKNKD